MTQERKTPLSDKYPQLVAEALQYAANYIETGSILFSAVDVDGMGEDSRRQLRLRCKALDSDQMKKVLRLRKMSEEWGGSE